MTWKGVLLKRRLGSGLTPGPSSSDLPKDLDEGRFLKAELEALQDLCSLLP